MRRLIIFLFGLALILKGCDISVFTKTGSLKGRVVNGDNHAEGIPGVTLEIGVKNRLYKAVTNSNGDFEMVNVPVGRQTLSILHEGFKPFTREVTVADGASIPLGKLVLEVDRDLYSRDRWIEVATAFFQKAFSTLKPSRKINAFVIIKKTDSSRNCNLRSLTAGFVARFHNRLPDQLKLNLVNRDPVIADEMTREFERIIKNAGDFDEATLPHLGERHGVNVLIFGDLTERTDNVYSMNMQAVYLDSTTLVRKASRRWDLQKFDYECMRIQSRHPITGVAEKIENRFQDHSPGFHFEMRTKEPISRYGAGESVFVQMRSSEKGHLLLVSMDTRGDEGNIRIVENTGQRQFPANKNRQMEVRFNSPGREYLLAIITELPLKETVTKGETLTINQFDELCTRILRSPGGKTATLLKFIVDG